ncbi:MAG: tetratricopeptide repeat protein, partial [Desulfococcaceae bacterium]
MAPAGRAALDVRIREGFRIHRNGDIGGAAAVYREVLELLPDHPDGLHLLGVTCYQEGDFAEAESLIRRAIERNPGAASYHSN